MNNNLFFYTFCAVLGLLVAVAISIISNKNKKIKTEYDERQEAIRGRGFKYAFFTACGLLLALYIIDLSETALPMGYGLICFSVIIISGLVLSIYAIIKDAYWGSNSNRKRFTCAMGVITLINIVASIVYFKEGMLIKDGILTDSFANVECALIFIILFVVSLIKNLVNKSDEEEEE